jgi:hypothetical protein
MNLVLDQELFSVSAGRGGASQMVAPLAVREGPDSLRAPNLACKSLPSLFGQQPPVLVARFFAA